ncbi:hypothetical protein QF026_000249 [Streptomyces aurantiacus]|uniref:hypothetical protein n=1 Tax=Streptomyces aurantiacus TaxID=47760 RepID=UPI00278DAC77|nr:hypothetical protein [Streptomyces aurantiacus]MDQ0771783.1 hypothetical protein [Streptomyces aurantiacus]
MSPDVLAGNAPVPRPVRLSTADGDKAAGTDSCSPAALDAAAAKAKPVDAATAAKTGVPAGGRAVTCLRTGDIPAAGRAARDAAIAEARRQAPDTLQAPRDATATLRDDDPQTKEVLPIPDWCYDHVGGGWWGFRTSMCQITDVAVYIWYGTPSGQRVHIGTALALEYAYAFTSDLIDRFAFQVTVRKYWGERIGASGAATITGAAYCTGDCKPDGGSGSLRPGQFRDGVDNEGDSYWLSTRSEPGGIGYPDPEWEWNVQYLFTLPSTTRSVSPPSIRCDNAFEDDGNNSGDPETPGIQQPTIGAGCVFLGIVPVMEYSKTGFYPTLAQHIEAAQQSGLPGAYPNGVVLTRLQDAAKKRANGDRACPRGWVRPTGKSCDEYPFRSTYQGATQTTGTGRTFAPPTVAWCEMDPAWGLPTGVTGPDGWSSCMIDRNDNSQGGAALGSFYRSNRVLDLDPFFVHITP